MENELYHHGILGQKWGVRRFETKSGHLTPAGKARYDEYTSSKENLKSARKALSKLSGSGNDRAVNKAKGMYDLRKKQYSDAKAKMKMNGRSEAGKTAGKREQKLVEMYKSKGMSQAEAEVAAYKRAKLEKTLAIAAGVTVAAATAYGVKKYHDYVSDEMLKVGKVSMKRVASSDSKDLHDTFYAAFSKKDANKYVGLYGKQVKGYYDNDVYQKTIDLKSNLKIASDKHAKDAMVKVLQSSSDEKRKELISQLEMKTRLIPHDTTQGRMVAKGLRDIKSGKYGTKAAYDAFNLNMTNGNQAPIYKDFKSLLKSSGYSGIKDRNDASYSGYNAKTARIIFDTSKVKVSDVRKLSSKEIDTHFNKESSKVMAKELVKEYTKQGLPYAAIIGAGGIAGTAMEKQARKTENAAAIRKYKKQHPDTKLTNDEILENYYGGK